MGKYLFKWVFWHYLEREGFLPIAYFQLPLFLGFTIRRTLWGFYPTFGGPVFSFSPLCFQHMPIWSDPDFDARNIMLCFCLVLVLFGVKPSIAQDLLLTAFNDHFLWGLELCGMVGQRWLVTCKASTLPMYYHSSPQGLIVCRSLLEEVRTVTATEVTG